MQKILVCMHNQAFKSKVEKNQYAALKIDVLTRYRVWEIK